MMSELEAAFGIAIENDKQVISVFAYADTQLLIVTILLRH